MMAKDNSDNAMSNVTSFDAEKFKAATREQWNKSAKGWSDASTPIHAWLEASTKTMLDLADVKLGSRVLDVAAGAGDQTLDIAERVGPTGYVLASDLSPDILAFAKENARRAGYNNVDVKEADGEKLDVEPASFDAAVSRLGMMFFPDPLTGLLGIFRALKPGGRACVMVFSSPETNPCITILVSTALKHAGLPPRDPYQPGGLLSLGKPGMIDALFKKAGFSKVETKKVSAPFNLPSVNDYLSFIATSAGPILQILDNLDESVKAAAWTEIEDRLSAFNTKAGWEGPNELILAAGRR